jgi:hypothetical protein
MILLRFKKTDPLEPLCKKTAYHTFEEAQDIIKYIREKRAGKEIHPYKCEVCGFWHLTSKSE